MGNKRKLEAGDDLQSKRVCFEGRQCPRLYEVGPESLLAKGKEKCAIQRMSSRDIGTFFSFSLERKFYCFPWNNGEATVAIVNSNSGYLVIDGRQRGFLYVFTAGEIEENLWVLLKKWMDEVKLDENNGPEFSAGAAGTRIELVFFGRFEMTARLLEWHEQEYLEHSYNLESVGEEIKKVLVLFDSKFPHPEKKICLATMENGVMTEQLSGLMNDHQKLTAVHMRGLLSEEDFQLFLSLLKEKNQIHSVQQRFCFHGYFPKSLGNKKQKYSIGEAGGFLDMLDGLDVCTFNEYESETLGGFLRGGVGKDFAYTMASIAKNSFQLGFVFSCYKSGLTDVHLKPMRDLFKSKELVTSEKLCEYLKKILLEEKIDENFQCLAKWFANFNSLNSTNLTGHLTELEKNQILEIVVVFYGQRKPTKESARQLDCWEQFVIDQHEEKGLSPQKLLVANKDKWLNSPLHLRALDRLINYHKRTPREGLEIIQKFGDSSYLEKIVLDKDFLMVGGEIDCFLKHRKISLGQFFSKIKSERMGAALFFFKQCCKIP